MNARAIETDYLVVGCGTGGMAFTDTLIAHSQARVVMVDRRERPGGHWNDAYPFVRLHQPSIFEPDRITLQQVRACAPSFNSALAAFVEATRADCAEQNRLCPVTPYPYWPNDWARIVHNSLLASAAWENAPEVRAWAESSRLNTLRGVAQQLHKPRMQQALKRYAKHSVAAFEKLTRFRAEVEREARA
jgi:hypothetical protein